MPERIASLEINSFRGLSNLEIEDLTDVNLFVGRNNTGKTTLLEAIRLLVSSDPRVRLYELLADREEFNFRSFSPSYRNAADSGSPLAFEAIFYGRPDLHEQPQFSIVADRFGYAIHVRYTWLRREAFSEEASVRYVSSEGPEVDPDAVPGFEIHSHAARILLPFDRITRTYVRRRLISEIDPQIVYLPSVGMSTEEIGRIWDTIALTDEEDEVIEALRIIAPTLEKLVMVQAPDSRSRMLMAKLRQFRAPVPFKSLGEGTSHLLGIVLAMLKAKGGLVLFDEIENGVHYSVQSQLWDMIFRQAKKLGTQVFATTHSWDSIEGFQIGSQAHSRRAGALFRLEETPVGCHVTRFSTSEIEIADRESIEVR